MGKDETAERSLTHLNAAGDAHMVDVSEKSVTARSAKAKAELHGSATVVSALMQGTKKGDALATARIAGIMAAKKTSEIVPLCHPIALSSVEVEISQSSETMVEITVLAKTLGVTGVEMEALTAASAAALTLYDMGKALDKEMIIQNLRLIEKTGGKSGHFERSV